MTIKSLEELAQHQATIIRRIEAVPNGGLLFALHPFRMLADIGVELSEKLKAQLVEQNPALRSLTESPYQALKSSSAPQPVDIRLRGLFGRSKP
jgi:hypothetical protein